MKTVLGLPQSLKRVVLSLVLLSSAGLVLLLSDLHSRRGARSGAEGPGESVATGAAAPDGQTLGRTWRIREVSYIESVMVEEAMRGLRDGLEESGLRPGADFTLNTLSAQGDMASLGSLFDSARTAGTDLYVVYSTPALQAALKKSLEAPLVFTVVANPFVAGAGETDVDHLPNVTGVYTLGPYREMAELLAAHFPRIKRVGTLFCPAEANSVANKEAFVREAERRGMTVEALPVNTASELSDAALALSGRRLDAFVQVIDNLTTAGFPTIARVAAQARIPVFACQGAAVRQGAVLALSRDYYDAGRDTALKAARVMRGEDPAAIPFSPPSTVKKFVNLKSARECGLDVPAALLEGAEIIDPETRP
jgi:ABC-type uncharacterized transport system substrate-binding protein